MGILLTGYAVPYGMNLYSGMGEMATAMIY